MNNISSSSLAELFLNETPLIDVRAPVEFALGALPGAVNLPIMNNEERAQVGTAYKQTGREKAMALGHKLVSGEVREARLQLWSEHIRLFPQSVLYCFRGGLRSQITQRWLGECGVTRPLIEGGYKEARRFLREEIEQFSSTQSALMLSGPTGSAKTHLLKQVSPFYPSLDLEGLACHRGSAFGAMTKEQPSQIDFENAISIKLLKLSTGLMKQKVLIEDESRLIGRCAVPESLFERMRQSELVFVEESLEQRVENIFSDYILQTAICQGDQASALAQFAAYRKATEMISRRLGGLRTQEVLQDLLISESRFLKDPEDLESNKAWITKLLSYYYDPLYASNLEKRSPKIVMKGNSTAVVDYLRGL